MKFVVLAILLFSMNGWANIATLKEVKSSQTAEGFVAEFLFDQAVDNGQATVDFINETIQVNLANAKVAKSKISTKVQDEKVKSIYTYDLDANNSRARIILNKGLLASSFENKTILKVEGNKLVVTLTNKLPIGTPVEADLNLPISDEDLSQASQWISDADKLKQTTEEKKKIESLKESEIPVLAEKKAIVKESTSPTASKIFLSFGIVVILIAGTSLFFKKMLKKTPKNKNSQIKVLTQYYLGPRKSLAIVRVAGESVLIGVTDSNINLIKTLALLDEEIPAEMPDTFESSFSSMLENGSEKSNVGYTKNATSIAAQKQDASSDEFSFSKVKDFVSNRLKNMKEL